MNIFKLKFKLHKFINILFYFIIFVLGYLCGYGILDIKNIFFDNVKAMSWNGYNSDIDCISFNRDRDNTYFMINNEQYEITALDNKISLLTEFNLFKSTNSFTDSLISYTMPEWTTDRYNGESVYVVYLVFNGKFDFATGSNLNTPISSSPVYVNSSGTFISSLDSNNYHAYMFFLGVDSKKAYLVNSKSDNVMRSLSYSSTGYTLFNYYIEDSSQEPRYKTRWSTGVPTFTQLVKDYTNFYNGFNFPTCLLEPSFEYNIVEGTNEGKRINMSFTNFSSDMSVEIEDMYTSEITLLNDFPERTTYTIDNISFDSIYYVSIYKNDVLWGAYTIDVANELNIKGNNRFVNFAILKDSSNPRFVFSFENTKSGDSCYIDFEGTKKLVDCQEQYIYTVNDGDIHYNSMAIFSIENGGSQVYYKGYTVNLLDNQPSIFFNNYLNKEDNSSTVDIIVSNLQSNDIIKYSYDNIEYYDFPNQRVNTLVLYQDTPLYVKIYRNDTLVASGYYYVNLDKFNNSSIDSYNDYNGTNIFNIFKNISSSVDFSILDYFGEFWNLLKQSRLFLILNIFVIGSLALYLLKAFRR